MNPVIQLAQAVAAAAAETDRDLFFASNPLAGFVLDADTLRIRSANRAAEDLYEYGAAELEGMNFAQLCAEEVVLNGSTRHVRQDSSQCRVMVASAGEGGTLAVMVQPAGMWSVDQADYERRWHLLEMMAENHPLDTTLTKLVELTEARCPGLAASVLLLREGKLYHQSGSRVDAALVEALDGLPIEGTPGEAVSPCWAPNDSFIDIQADSRWRPWREPARSAGVACCWLEAILSPAGEWLGVLAAWLPRVRPPRPGERAALRISTHMAALFIEQRHLLADLEYQAHHDSATRVLNAYRFEEVLQADLVAAEAEARAVAGALLMISTDRLGTVRDLLGRPTGEILLEQVARRVEGLLRTPYRIGRACDDSFCLWLPRVDAGAAAEIAEELRSRLAAPFSIAGNELFVTASIGVAVGPEHGRETAELGRSACAALDEAVRRGRDNVVLFRPGKGVKTRQHVILENALAEAVARHELLLHYQPQVALAGGGLVGAEALMRWRHSSIGTVSPGVFIPIAEESGLIVPLGVWALREACRQMVEWLAGGLSLPRVAVNVSSVQFARPDFVDVVEHVLRDAGLAPQRLELELTESAMLGDVEAITAKMQALGQMGISLAIDDFGTGYSSLQWLQRLPVNTIKIDRTFVQQIVRTQDRPPLLETMLRMARALGKPVVAEGVETEEQAAALTMMGCEVVQGYLFGRPVDPGGFVAVWGPPGGLAGATSATL